MRTAPWSDFVEVHWAPGAEAYVTPIADDCVGVAVLKSRRGGFDSHLAEFPGLRDRIEGLPHEPDTGFVGRDETLLALDRAFDSAQDAE